MDEIQFHEVVSRLDSILKLLALNTVQGRSLKEQVSLLSSVGFQPKQIAEMLGKTPNHVSVILHDLRKKQVSSNESVEEPTEPNAAGQVESV